MADVVYKFVAADPQSVVNAFNNIDAAAKRSANTVRQSYAQQGAAAKRTATEQASAARRPASRTDQLAKQVERDQIRAAQREARERERSLAHVARIRERHNQDETRQQAAHVNRVLRLNDQRERATIRGAEQRGRRAVQVESQFNARIEREREGRLGRIGGELKGFALGAAGTAGALGLGLAGVATRDAFGLQGQANRISIAARGAGEKAIDPNTLRREFEATAIASKGTVKADEVADAVGRYISLTGDVKTARAGQGVFATVASATSGNIGDVAETVASLSQQFDIKGLEDMKDVLAALAYQGKAGAFELKDAAAKYQGLAAAGASFGLGKGTKAVKTLGGLTQIARGGSESADVAGTNVRALFGAYKTKAAEFEKEGVDVYKRDKTGKATGLRDFADVIVDTISKVGGSDIDVKSTKLSKLLDKEGFSAISTLVGTFSNTLGSTKGTDDQRMGAATRAIREQLMKAINAPGSWQDIEIDADQAMADPTNKLAAQYESLKAAAADKLVPAIGQLLDKLEASPDIIDAFIGTIENLLKVFEVGIELMRSLGLIKDEDTAAGRRKKDEATVAKTTRELSTLGSDEKVAALRAQGKNAEADEMLNEMNKPENLRRRFQLQATRDVARKAIGQSDALDKSIRDVQTPQQFEELYASLAADPKDEVQQKIAQAAAKDISRFGGESKYATTDGVVGVNETEAQKRARLGYVGNVSEQRILAGGKSGGEGADIASSGLEAALKRMTAAADEAAAALKKTSDSTTGASVVTG